MPDEIKRLKQRIAELERRFGLKPNVAGYNASEALVGIAEALKAGSNVAFTKSGRFLVVAATGGGGSGAPSPHELLGTVHHNRTTLTAKTISSDQIAFTFGADTGYLTLAGEGGVDDDLDGITGGAEGDVLVLSPVSDTVTITLKHNNAGGSSGAKLFLSGGSDITLDDINDSVMLVYKTALDAGNGGWMQVGGSGGGSGHTIKNEGAALTARANLNFIGEGVVALDDAGNSETEVGVGAYFDAIVDQNSATVGRGNVYSTIQAAVTAGHKQVFVRSAGDTSDITIGAGDAVTRIFGSSTQNALVAVNVTCNKAFVSFEYLTFATSLIGTAKTLKLGGANCLVLGCLFLGTGSTPTVQINNAAGITASAATIDYDTEIGAFPSRGMAMIHRASNSDREWFVYTGKSATQLTGISRGAHFTPAQAFDDNDVITSMSTANLVVDAPNCQVVQCVWNAPSGFASGLWLTENSDGARITANQFLTVSNRSCIMAGQNDAAAGPDNISIIGNVFDTHVGEDAVLLGMQRDDTALSSTNNLRFWQLSGNSFTGAFASGAIMSRMENWNIAGNTFNGGTRDSRTALINQASGISASDTTIPYDTEGGAGSWPNKGWFVIDNEMIWYGNKTATAFRSCLRGCGGTTAASHADNTIIRNRTQTAIGCAQTQDNLRPIIVSGNQLLNLNCLQAAPTPPGTGAGFFVWSGNSAAVGVTILYSTQTSQYLGNNFRSLTIDFLSKTGQLFFGAGMGGSMTFSNIPTDMPILGMNVVPTGAGTKNSLPSGDTFSLGRSAGDTSQICIPLINKTGATSVANDVVLVDTANDYSFIKPAGSPAALNVVGVVVQGGVADGSPALVAVSGVVAVTCTTAGAVTRGAPLEYSATAGQAQASAAPPTDAIIFGKALTAKAAATAGTVLCVLTP
jgi:hypothetical protein